MNVNGIFLRAIAFLAVLVVGGILAVNGQQELRVTELKATGDVLHGKQIRTDVNGAEAAVVKVQLPVAGATFDGNLIGEPVYYGSEYWVWLEGDAAGSGTSMFDIRCPGARTLRVDFSELGTPVLHSKIVYELVLDVPDRMLYGNGGAPADIGGDYFLLTVSPKENIMVKIDGKPKVMKAGQLSEFLTYGDHEYSVEAPGYISQTGTVSLTRGGGKIERNISLVSAMSRLTVNCETPGAVISINGQRRGTGSWEGELTAGNYQIEAKLDGYRSYSAALLLNEAETKTISIPELTPIYATLHVDYYPLKSQVKIDGKNVGTTPLALSNVTAGRHKVEISSDDYIPFTQDITLSESEPLRLAGELKEKTSDHEVSVSKKDNRNAPDNTREIKNRYEQGKKFDDSFIKSISQNGITLDGALSLLKAMELYDQAESLCNQSNSNGNSVLKKIDQIKKKHTTANDFYNAAVVLYNSDKKFPEAYTAFMLGGNAAKEYKTVPDTIYAVYFYNAGLAAYGKDIKASVNAFEAARAANINDVNAYIYDIACRQEMVKKDAEYAKQASEEIFIIASEGLKRFGPTPDILLNIYIQHFIDNKKYDEALGELDRLAARYPDKANIYMLKGLLSTTTKKYKDAIRYYKKMGQLTSRPDYLAHAATNLNSIGTITMDNFGRNVTPDQKADVLDILNTAYKFANRVKANPDADPKLLEDINNTIERIQYNMENAKHL